MQADLEFKACLDYRVKSRTTRATQKPCLKNKKIFKKFHSFANFVYGGGVASCSLCVKVRGQLSTWSYPCTMWVLGAELRSSTFVKQSHCLCKIVLITPEKTEALRN